jgi:hypothetical protein
VFDSLGDSCREMVAGEAANPRDQDLHPLHPENAKDRNIGGFWRQ